MARKYFVGFYGPCRNIYFHGVRVQGWAAPSRSCTPVRPPPPAWEGIRASLDVPGRMRDAQRGLFRRGSAAAAGAAECKVGRPQPPGAVVRARARLEAGVAHARARVSGHRPPAARRPPLLRLADVRDVGAAGRPPRPRARRGPSSGAARCADRRIAGRTACARFNRKPCSRIRSGYAGGASRTRIERRLASGPLGDAAQRAAGLVREQQSATAHALRKRADREPHLVCSCQHFVHGLGGLGGGLGPRNRCRCHCQTPAQPASVPVCAVGKPVGLSFPQPGYGATASCVSGPQSP